VGGTEVLVQAVAVLLLVVQLVRHGGWGLLVLQGLVVVVEGERKIRVDHNIWAEHAAQEAAQEDGKEIKLSIIVSNDIYHCILDDWSLSPKSTAWDSPSATKYMAVEITHLPLC
jgi:hypothetical protein